jgi:DNA-binding response OmpR family regulator
VPDNTTLLLLEPDRATRQLYVRELARHWRVIAAEGAAEVLPTLAGETIHAVILELGAAEDDDWTLLTKIRGNPASAQVPIIMCSTVDARSKGYALGVSSYLVKPVSAQQLVSEVARWLETAAGPGELR